MNKTRIQLLLLFLILFSTGNLVRSQMQRIMHLNGTKSINGIDVTVTKSGRVDSLHYCGEDTGPYYLGYNYAKNGPGDGSYTFTFSKPIDEIVFNVAAMSHSTGTYGEETIVEVNGAHYRFTRLGSLNSCGESQCIITREGDISPCANCTGSGTNGIKIKGPITTFTIKCHIISGDPRGFVAAVWISGKASDAMVSYKTQIRESDAGEGKELVINGAVENATITVKDANGDSVILKYKTVEKAKLVIDLNEWLSGSYILEIEQNKKIERQTITIS